MARKQNLYPYHLIDEEIHYSGHHEESSWDADHRGNGGVLPPTIDHRVVKSVLTTFPVFQRRNITEEVSGVVTFEGTFRVVSGDGLYFGFWGDKGDEKEAFVLRQNGTYFYAGAKAVFKVDTEWHYVKFVLDIDKGEVKVHLDGKFVVELPFTGKAKTLSRFEFGYGKQDTGEAMFFNDLEVYKNYIFCDSIVPKYDGNLPEEYEIKKEGKVTLGRRRYSPASKYSTYFMRAGSGTSSTVTRRFERASGKGERNSEADRRGR